MSTFKERYDSNKRVAMWVLRTSAMDNAPYFVFLCLVLPFAPIFWAFFAWKDGDKPPADKNQYP